MMQKETRSLHCLGGILADDQVTSFESIRPLDRLVLDLSYVSYLKTHEIYVSGPWKDSLNDCAHTNAEVFGVKI